jgi:hypothetical protein
MTAQEDTKTESLACAAYLVAWGHPIIRVERVPPRNGGPASHYLAFVFPPSAKDELRYFLQTRQRLHQRIRHELGSNRSAL